MRPILLASAVMLASLAVQAQQVPTLQSQLQAIAAQHHGKVALFAENLQTHATVALSPDEPVPTASVIKLAILYEALEQVRAGKAHLDDKLTLTGADQVPGSGVLQQFDTPMALTLKDVLSMMIEMSDNTATNLAIDHLGLANINARMAELGLKNTYLYKKVFKPVAPGTAVPPDQPRFGLGKTTPREMASLMTRFVTCDLGNPAAAGDAHLCAVALHMLQSQFYRDGIPRYLDTMPGAAGDSIANKSGSLDAVRNDVGAIATRSGIAVISIFTYENADHSWTADNEGDATTAKLARAIIAAWSPQGLTAWPVPLTKKCGGC
jgi:beta-lactamase class A